MHSFPFVYICSLLLLFILFFVPPIHARAIDQDDVSPTSRRQSPYHRRLSTQLLAHPRQADDNTCPSGYAQCGNGLPTSFCCGETDTCLSVAEGTTALCCPAGQDCDSIVPMSCDVAYQNATAYPTLAVHTTNLTGQLPTCGAGCCPFGYTCSSGGDSATCQRITSDNDLITATTTASVSPAMMTTTTTSTAVGTGVSGYPTTLIVAPSASTTATTGSVGGDTSSHSSTSPRTIGIAAGSAAAGLMSIITVVIFIWAKRRRRRLPSPPLQQQQLTRTSPEPLSPPPPILGLDHHRQLKVTSLSQFPNTPPPLPEKEPYQLPAKKKKRKSILSWVPSFINRGSPAELPASPVEWGRLPERRQQQPENDDNFQQAPLAIQGEIHELEAPPWLPQQRFI